MCYQNIKYIIFKYIYKNIVFVYNYLSYFISNIYFIIYYNYKIVLLTEKPDEIDCHKVDITTCKTVSVVVFKVF